MPTSAKALLETQINTPQNKSSHAHTKKTQPKLQNVTNCNSNKQRDINMRLLINISQPGKYIIKLDYELTQEWKVLRNEDFAFFP